MKKIGLLLITMTVVGTLTYMLMYFTGNTSSVSEEVSEEASQIFENSYSNQIMHHALETASLISKKSDDPSKLGVLFNELSYDIACMQIIELETQASKMTGLILKLMLKQEDLRNGYLAALDHYRVGEKGAFTNHTLRPDISMNQCQSEMTASEKRVYLQRWKDFIVKNRG